MPLPDEKNPKDAFVIGERENEVHDGVKVPYHADTERPVYIDSKRTWRSFFWSSKSLEVRSEEEVMEGFSC